MSVDQEIYGGLGEYYPNIFYMHLNIGITTDNTIPIKLYEYYNKIQERPIIYVFDVYCEFLGNDIVSRKYDLLCITRDYDMSPPTQDLIFNAIKEIMTYRRYIDNLFYNLELREFYPNDDQDIREVCLTLLRSLGKMSEYKTIYV